MNTQHTTQPSTAVPRLVGPWRRNLNPARWEVQVLAEVALAVGLAAALGLLKPFTMPQGGSVSLEMLPLVFLAIRRGVGPALVAGGLYGFVQLILPGAFMYHPAQVALDYPLAFMAVAAAGLVRVTSFRTLCLAVAAGTGARFVFHFLSGLIFFASYAPAWEAPWLYSITYNLLYLVPEAVITALVLWPLLKAYDAAFPGSGRHAGRTT
jgi:thiamine transporter